MKDEKKLQDLLKKQTKSEKKYQLKMKDPDYVRQKINADLKKRPLKDDEEWFFSYQKPFEILDIKANEMFIKRKNHLDERLQNAPSNRIEKIILEELKGCWSLPPDNQLGVGERLFFNKEIWIAVQLKNHGANPTFDQMYYDCIHDLSYSFRSITNKEGFYVNYYIFNQKQLNSFAMGMADALYYDHLLNFRKEKSNLRWNRNKTDAALLIHALIKSGCILENGQPISKINLVTLFEDNFNLRLPKIHDLVKQAMDSTSKPNFLKTLLTEIESENRDK